MSEFNVNSININVNCESQYKTKEDAYMAGYKKALEDITKQFETGKFYGGSK